MNKLKLEPSLLKKIYQFYLQFYHCLQKFPKRSRYTLGQKIEINLLDLIELIALANTQTRTLREPILHRASAKNELLKLLIRLAHELNLFNYRQYLALEGQIQEIGRMIGGWIKFTRTQ